MINHFISQRLTTRPGIISIRFLTPLLISLFLLFPASGCTSIQDHEVLSLHMIDVGQGDSFLITTPAGKALLIDAGDPAQGDRVSAYLKQQKVQHIDHLIATHPHADHIGGMKTVIDTFSVSQAYLPPVVHTSALFESMLNSLQHNSIPLTLVGETVVVHQEQDVVIQILSTGKDYINHLNNWSLVVHVTHGHHSFLLTGDLEKEGEEDLLAAFHPNALRATVLKAGHHGSATSSTEAFLDAVAPEIVLISCGEVNTYGHPDESVLDRIEKRSAWIYRTDLQGTVVITSDGESVYSHLSPWNLH